MRDKKHVVITLGPIPARLDSVKYITNKFRGGLMMKLAEILVSPNVRITIVRSKLSTIVNPSGIEQIVVDDVNDYYDTLMNMQDVDAFILGAAVANLIPSYPWKGKFPSHKYSVGEKFNIEFEIAPRVIDNIKRAHPRCCLIGYKLFDGHDDELIAAAKKTLRDSKANAIFANVPQSAMHKKFMLTQDGAVMNMSFDEHMTWVARLVSDDFYRTIRVPRDTDAMPDALTMFEHAPTTGDDGMLFGTFALRDRDKGGFWTTTRGHRDDGVVRVLHVDHNDLKVITAGGKATLNAPLLDMILRKRDDVDVILHDHKMLKKTFNVSYELPGSSREVSLAQLFKERDSLNIEHHGYVAAFKDIDSALIWIAHQRKANEIT